MRHKKPKSTESDQRKPYQNGRGQVVPQVGIQMGSQMGTQMGTQAGRQAGYQMGSQMGTQAVYQTATQAVPQVGPQAVSQSGRGRVGSQAVPQMGGQMRSQAGTQSVTQPEPQRAPQAGSQPASQAELAQKELRHMSRAELLELLLAQAEENEKLRQQLKVAQQALADRRIGISQSGTMAEAALRLNGVFEAADKAARQYLENVQRTAWENRNRQ